MELIRLSSRILRVAQLASAVIVAGITGFYLSKSTASNWDLARFIYAEVLASISIFCSILFLFPFVSTFLQAPVDIILTLAWWAAFGLFVQLLGFPCDFVFEYTGVAPFGDQCGKFRADIAFTTMSCVFWMASAIVTSYIELSSVKEEVEAERREKQKEQDLHSDSDV